MKTKEESAELKSKYEKTRELTEEETTEVIGGRSESESVIIGSCKLTGLVGMYNANQGQSYYIALYDSFGQLCPCYGHGRLVRTYEEPDSHRSRRVHEFEIDSVSSSDFYNYGTVTPQGYRKYKGSDVSLYTSAMLVG